MLVAGAAPLKSDATVITLPADAEQTMWAEYQGGSDSWSYTVATQTWSFSTNITGRFLSLGSTLFVDDLDGGAYTVNAQIDGDGNVLGGAFSWVSSSPTLGLAAPQLFLTGTILGSQPTTAGGVMRLWASIDYINPAFESWTTAPNFAALSFIGAPCWLPCAPLPGPSPFASDSFGTVIQPDIFGFHVKVEEPSLAAALWLAVIGGGVLSRRRALANR